MTWQPGHDRIAELVAAGELQQVTADRAMAQLLLDDARRHLGPRGRRRHTIRVTGFGIAPA